MALFYNLIFLIAFLFPVAGYLLILGWINRRATPLMVPGTWDFVGLLVGASGFILVGGGFVVNTLADQWQLMLLTQSRSGSNSSVGLLLLSVLLILYVLGIVVGVVFILQQRASFTVVYNVHPDIFEQVLCRILEDHHFDWQRQGYLWIIRTHEEATDNAEPDQVVALPLTSEMSSIAPSEETRHTASLILSPSALMYNVGMKWEYFTDSAERAIRDEIEIALRRSLENTPTEDNPVSLWQLATASVLLLTIFLSVVLLFFFIYNLS